MRKIFRFGLIMEEKDKENYIYFISERKFVEKNVIK